MTRSMLFRLRLKLHRIKRSAFMKAVKRVEHRALAKATVGCHLGYYSLVSFEAHGHYRYMAGILAVLVMYEAFSGESSD